MSHTAPLIFWPSGSNDATFLFTKIGESTVHECLSKPTTNWTQASPRIETTTGGAASISSLTFPAPRFHINSNTAITVIFHYRYAPLPGGSAATDIFILDIPLVISYDTNNIPVSEASGAYRDYSFTLATNPLTSAAWTLADLVSLSATGVNLKIGSGTGGELDIAMIYLYWEATGVTHVPGSGRWKHGPLRFADPAQICAICGVPKHASDLIEVTDDRHPHFGLYVCGLDLDEIDPEPTGPELLEGDLDPFDR